MKKVYIIFLFALGTLSATAQSTAGITGMKDTSYNTLNEYNKHKKNYPSIEIVRETHAPSVVEEKDIVYCKTGERELKLDVFYPAQKNKTKRTAIIFIH